MNIEDIDRLATWMRSVGAYRARLGDMELVLGPSPQSHEEQRPLTDEEAVAALKERQEHRDKLLFASSEGFPDDFEGQ